MSNLLHDLVLDTAYRSPDADALRDRGETLVFATLASQVLQVGKGLIAAGIGRRERVAVYLPKQREAVLAMFGASAAGAVFVPVNPLLKAEQVAYILQDCNVRLLVTSRDRAAALAGVLPQCHDLHTLVLVDAPPPDGLDQLELISWDGLTNAAGSRPMHRVVDADMAAILYTSGSTGKPKGVVLSHCNMVSGARSVASYLQNEPSDRILAVLPFSFDYGFSQLSTAFVAGACAVLMEYLLPRDVVRAVERERITGLAGVPPLWVQLAGLDWPAGAARSLRYLTNSGGRMPRTALAGLRSALPGTNIYLMYGLTEAFRSTFLPPEEVDARPDSIGKAIPNAEIMVVREDGSPCAPGEPGELVHRGSLVALGYWNDAAKTAERFRPGPQIEPGLVLPEIAVWSGDTVRADEDGYLYFIGRQDDMIKTSGYRVSPTEVEEVAYATGLAAEASAIGVGDEALGQVIVLVVVAHEEGGADTAALRAALARELPAFMTPQRIEWRSALPRNPNGKIDRKLLATELEELLRQADA